MVLKNLPAQLMSRKILGVILDDLAVYGSIPIYLLFTLVSYFTGNNELFLRLIYCFAISTTIILIVKGTHYTDRPKKEEFTIFMEKIMASSFPSGHSLNSTVLTILFILAFPYLWLHITAIVLAVLTYIQRYVRKKHFFIDIIVGILIGIIEVVFVVRVL